MLSHIKVLQPGLQTSIQDSGRYGYLSEGVPISGAMDQSAFKLANLLVGNTENCAVIEWCLLPPKLQFKKSTLISFTGASIQIFINGKEKPLNAPIIVPKNGIISFGKLVSGVYGYIAVKNGFQTKKVLGSRSKFKTITKKVLLKKEMRLPYFPINKIKKFNSKIKISQESNPKIKVFKGPEFDMLTSTQKTAIFKKLFSISNLRNRMGIQLEENFHSHNQSILSSPVLPGTVQWTPSGKLIVLMRDAQTIGGYPRILQLSEDSINKIAQFSVGQEVWFEFVE